MKHIVLISDTHALCDEKLCKYFTECDEIWHAGDIGSFQVVDTLRQYAPLRAVHGNIDGSDMRREFPEFLHFTLEGVSVVMTHIGGFPGKYSPSALAQILHHKPTLFVCGHSHILRVIYDKNLNTLTMNPGAAGNQGFHQVRTLLRFDIDNGNISNFEVVEIPRSFN